MEFVKGSFYWYIDHLHSEFLDVIPIRFRKVEGKVPFTYVFDVFGRERYSLKTTLPNESIFIAESEAIKVALNEIDKSVEDYTAQANETKQKLLNRVKTS